MFDAPQTGGAYKYSALVRDRIGLQLHKKDELSCLLVGLNFLLDAEPDECFFLPDPRDPHVSATLPRSDGDAPLYPYLLVNIGSGVSILRVDGPDRCARGGDGV